ncbi:MAG: GMC family oxidoreductase [Motiliproteus sp.]
MTDEVDVDVVIVGAGAGGSAAAWSLSKSGLRVLILESGPFYDPSRDYQTNTQQWEHNSFPHKSPGPAPYSFAPMQRLNPKWQHLRSWDKVRGLMTGNQQRRFGWRYHHVRGVGGSTLAFSGEAHRMNPDGMNMLSRYGVAADWPVSYDDLAPYYQQAEYQMGVSGPAKLALSQQPSNYLPAHKISYATSKLAQGCEKLGWEWQANPVAILSKSREGRPACNYCGQCNRGCPRRDKGSADLAFINPAMTTGRCRIKTGCQVRRILTGKNDRVRAVEYTDESQQLHTLKTSILILAAGAVQTPRLLLLSNSSASPEGLANESGQVGRNFMETLFWNSCALHPERLDSFRGVPSDGICWDFSNAQKTDDYIGGFRLSSGTLEAELGGPIAYATRLVPGWGAPHKEMMKNYYGHALCVGAVGESLPDDRSYIDLDPEKKDAQGDPVPRIHSHLADMELRRLAAMAKRCRKLLVAAGADTLLEEYGSYDVFSATHVFGTCRMGTDPEHSVTNAFGQSHRWNNLFIADASLFPSSGSGESPSLTIAALAIRQSHYIQQLIKAREW